MIAGNLQQLSPLAQAQGVLPQKVVWFDGLDDHIDYGLTSAFRMQNFLVTFDVYIMAWATNISLMCSDHELNTLTGWGFLSPPGGNGLFVRFNPGTEQRRLEYTTFRQECTSRWTLLAAYRKDATLKILSNGVIKASLSNGATIAYPGTAGAIVGAFHTGRNIQGIIKDVRIFDTTLLDIATIEAIAADPTIGTPLFFAPGNGVDSAAWAGGTVYGTPNACYIYPDHSIVRPL